MLRHNQYLMTVIRKQAVRYIVRTILAIVILAALETPVLDGAPEVPIRIYNSSKVSVESNSIKDMRDAIPTGIQVDDDCEDIKTQGNTVRKP
jgi:hypothetical protein